MMMQNLPPWKPMQIVMQKSSMDWLPNLAAGSEIFPPLRGTSDPRRHPTIPGIAPNKGQKWGKPVGFLAHGRGHFMLGHESVYNTFCGAGCTAQGPRIQIEFLLRAEEVRLPLYWVGFGLVTLLDSSQIVLMEEEFET